MNIRDMITEVQGALGLTTDGVAGPQTWTAIYNRIVDKSRKPAPPVEAVKPVESDLADARSERTIATLHDRVKPYARALVHAAADQGIAIQIISGTRTYDEQAELYAQGRSKPGPRVTNAGPGYSNHNFGIAFDIGVFQGGKYIEESPAYAAVGALGKTLGLEWGGNWKSLQDEPHFQLRPAWAAELSERDLLAGLRARKAAGRDAFAA